MPLTVEEVSSHSCTEQPRLQQNKGCERRGVVCKFLAPFPNKKLRRWRATRFFESIKKNRRAPATQVRPRGGAAAAAAVFCCTFAARSKQVVQEKLCAAGMEPKKKKKMLYCERAHCTWMPCVPTSQQSCFSSLNPPLYLQRLHYVLLVQLLHDIRRQCGSRLKC